MKPERNEALLTLATKAEKASPEEQRALLIEGWRDIFGMSPDDDLSTDDRGKWWEHQANFIRKLDAGAYVDAAMMLVPEGYGIRVTPSSILLRGSTVIVWRHDGGCAKRGDSEMLALAILAASCRALAQENHNANS